jgi:hypothetical protein
MWYGNDTIWRSIVDLNRIILYSDKQGNMQDTIQRRYLCITDAIVAGEGEGPLHPTPKKTNIIAVSDSAVAMDLFASTIMGFDWKKIPSIEKALNADIRWPLVNYKFEEVLIEYNFKRYNLIEIKDVLSFDFKPTKGWEGHIEK